MFSTASARGQSGPGDRPFERIQVDGQEVDGLDAVLAHDFVVGAATPEQAAVHERMQGLDPPPHDLGEARQAGDLGDRDPGFREEARGPPVDTSSTPSSCSERANSSIPCLSETLISARRTLARISHQLSSRGRRDCAVAGRTDRKALKA